MAKNNPVIIPAIIRLLGPTNSDPEGKQNYCLKAFHSTFLPTYQLYWQPQTLQDDKRP